MKAIRDPDKLLPAPPWRRKTSEEYRRIDAIVAELVRRLPATSDWRIQKAYYLAEVRSIEERLERLSRVDFAAWNHGPWSIHIREAYERLCQTGALVLECVRSTRRDEVDVYKVRDATKLPELDKATKDFLIQFLEEPDLGDGDKATAAAKATRPYVITKQNRLIDLDAYLDDIKRRHLALQRSKKARQLVEEAVTGG